MHVVVRQYEGASSIADAMAERPDEVKELLTGVEGFVAYYAVRDEEALTTVSICRDSAGREETTHRQLPEERSAWIAQQAGHATRDRWGRMSFLHGSSGDCTLAHPSVCVCSLSGSGGDLRADFL